MSKIVKIAVAGAFLENEKAISKLKNHYLKKLYDVIIVAENDNLEISSVCKNENSLVIYDASNAISNDKIQFWNNYDAVMYIENPNNINLDFWIGHPHLRYIKSDDVYGNLKAEIKSLFKSIELEKKFLIEYPNLDDLKKYKPFVAEIEQIYLLSENGSHRIRKRGKNGSYAYFETKKFRINGEKCYEYENTISKEIYEKLKKNADPNKHPIIKYRYCFLFQGQYFEMDVYPFWNDKAVIELELLSNKQECFLPPEIKVIEDVSRNKKYKNSYLARNVRDI